MTNCMYLFTSHTHFFSFTYKSLYKTTFMSEDENSIRLSATRPFSNKSNVHPCLHEIIRRGLAKKSLFHAWLLSAECPISCAM